MSLNSKTLKLLYMNLVSRLLIKKAQQFQYNYNHTQIDNCFISIYNYTVI